MATKNDLTQELVCDLFEYRDGELFYKKSRGHIKHGSMAGTIRKDARKHTIINGKHYMNHRIIFLMFNGYIPEFVDHIDNDPTNNRVENLRECTRTENSWNKRLQHNSTTKIKGVSWHKQSRKWGARITVNGKRMELGRFKDIELAELVAMEARRKYHKEFAHHG